MAVFFSFTKKLTDLHDVNVTEHSLPQDWRKVQPYLLYIYFGDQQSVRTCMFSLVI